MDQVNRVAAEFVTKSRAQGKQGPKRTGDDTSPLPPKHPRASPENSFTQSYPSIPLQGVSFVYFRICPSFTNHLQSLPNNQAFVPIAPSTSVPRLSTAPQMNEPVTIPTHSLNTDFSTQPPPNIGLPQQVYSIENDPLRFLDESQNQSRTDLYDVPDTTPGGFTGSEEQTPEFNVDDLFMRPDGSWFFPISNPWDVYMGNEGSGT